MSFLLATEHLTDGGGSALASWRPLIALLVIFVVILGALAAYGRPPAGYRGILGFALRPPAALERLTGIPGWAVATIGLSLFGLLVAGQGFYSDVAWHVALGRDEELFTAPHTGIVAGLGLIAAASVLGTLFATAAKVRTGVRFGPLRIPYSMMPLGALGFAAVSGFPLDEIWHGAYGIDVTMWSPTHMLMILGASFSGLASWLVLAEAGVRPRDSRWSAGITGVAAWLVLQGLASSQGEFDFGVPQFQQVFHPILVCIAAAFAFVAIRIALGRWWSIGVACAGALLDLLDLFGGEDGPVSTRMGGIYIGSAIVIELVAWALGTDRRLRFAVVSGVAVGTAGLATEWLYNQGAYQPWKAALLPEAVVLGTVAAVAAAVLAAAYARAVGRDARGKLPLPALLVAGLVLLVVLAWPMPRRVGDVTATIELERAGDDAVVVRAILDPPDAAVDNKWFQAASWQGGALVLAEMVPVKGGRPGEYLADGTVPIVGKGKAMLRLHRGDEMMSIAIRMPADPEIGEPEIPAVDRTTRFVSEQRYLLREQKPGASTVAIAVYGLLAGVALLWIAAFAYAVARVAPRSRPVSAVGDATATPAPRPAEPART